MTMDDHQAEPWIASPTPFLLRLSTGSICPITEVCDDNAMCLIGRREMRYHSMDCWGIMLQCFPFLAASSTPSNLSQLCHNTQQFIQRIGDQKLPDDFKWTPDGLKRTSKWYIYTSKSINRWDWTGEECPLCLQWTRFLHPVFTQFGSLQGRHEYANFLSSCECGYSG